MPAAADLLQTLKVKISLLADERVSGLDVNVDVDEGIARLTGTVESEEEKAVAEEVACSVEGVLDVENEIVVSPRVVQEDNIDETLAGVPAESVGMMGLAAAPAAYGGIAPGVVTVTPPAEQSEVSDDELAGQVRDAIANDVRIASKIIDVGVDHAIVQLSGIVDSFEEFSAVEETVSAVPGVRGVENDLEIEEAGYGCCQ